MVFHSGTSQYYLLWAYNICNSTFGHKWNDKDICVSCGVSLKYFLYVGNKIQHHDRSG